MQYSYKIVCVDARRQARRAFIAFSSDDTKVKVTDSEPTKGDIDNFLDQPVNDDAQSSKSTPVRIFSSNCFRDEIVVV
jgi:G patch domain-containing protein 1